MSIHNKLMIIGGWIAADQGSEVKVIYIYIYI